MSGWSGAGPRFSGWQGTLPRLEYRPSSALGLKAQDTIRVYGHGMSEARQEVHVGRPVCKGAGPTQVEIVPAHEGIHALQLPVCEVVRSCDPTGVTAA